MLIDYLKPAWCIGEGAQNCWCFIIQVQNIKETEQI